MSKLWLKWYSTSTSNSKSNLQTTTEFCLSLPQDIFGTTNWGFLYDFSSSFKGRQDEPDRSSKIPNLILTKQLWINNCWFVYRLLANYRIPSKLLLLHSLSVRLDDTEILVLERVHKLFYETVRQVKTRVLRSSSTEERRFLSFSFSKQCQTTIFAVLIVDAICNWIRMQYSLCSCSLSHSNPFLFLYFHPCLAKNLFEIKKQCLYFN